jgi:hypothetical protein
VSPAVLRAIFRYPVKSMLGESLAAATVEKRGLMGDRTFAVSDAQGRVGSGKTTRRFRRMDGLVDFRARLDGSDVEVIGPGGRPYAVTDPALAGLLTERLAMPVSLRSTDGVEFYDEGPVSVVTTASVAALSQAHGALVDVRRFRANLVVDVGTMGYPEDDWVGKEISVGDVVLRGRNCLQRCVVITLAQEELVEDRWLHTVGQAHGLDLALVADVLRPGTVRVGDDVLVR